MQSSVSFNYNIVNKETKPKFTYLFPGTHILILLLTKMGKQVKETVHPNLSYALFAIFLFLQMIYCSNSIPLKFLLKPKLISSTSVMTVAKREHSFTIDVTTPIQ